MSIKDKYINLLVKHEEEYFKKILIFFEDNVDKGARILDVGSGIGSLIKILKSKGYNNVYGVELDKEYVKYGREKFDCGDVLFALDSLKEKDKSFDVVVSFTVAEHVDDIQDFINFKLKYLKDGGIIYIFAPNYQRIKLYKNVIKNKLKGIKEHLTPFNSGSLLRSIWLFFKVSFWVFIKKFKRYPLMIKVDPLPYEVSLGGDADATWCCNYSDIRKCFKTRKDLEIKELSFDGSFIVKVDYKKQLGLNVVDCIPKKSDFIRL